MRLLYKLEDMTCRTDEEEGGGGGGGLKFSVACPACMARKVFLCSAVKRRAGVCVHVYVFLL